jgi:exoribonuclease-2
VVERVRIVSNLRLSEVDDAFADPARRSAQPHDAELRVLWAVARRLDAARGKADQERLDFSFYIDWERSAEGHVTIVPRLRGSPLDKLVSELMIHVNSRWGKLLAGAGWPGLFRTQQSGKVKMSTRPEPHVGLGLDQYLWASSPLRRYSDLVNQRQILALLAGGKPAYPEGDAELFATMADFEATYSQYAEFQSQMEHYWCLRWLLQEGVREVHANVLRENLVRLERLPLVMRVADLPKLAPETDVVLAIGAIDLLAATVEARFLRLATGG